MDNTLVIDEIRKGLPGISPANGNHLAEGCIVCLARSSHQNGIAITIEGIQNINLIVYWEDVFNEQIDRSWKDQIEATEHGAVCLAILIALKITDMTIIERSVIKSGFDYWLGTSENKEKHFQKKARLEISGIFIGSSKEIEGRLRKKLDQTNRSDNTLLPAYVSIIEFSQPYAMFVLKNEYN